MSSRWDAPPASSPPAAASSDAAAAAAAAAARIAAQYSAAGAGAGAGSAGSPPRGGASGPPEHDAEFTFDIEINDQRNRYMLTKGQTQQQLLKDTGASVTTKGTWYPDKALATEADPPLYLHIAATSREILDKGIEAVRELMKQELPDLNQDPRVRREMERGAPRETERRKWPEAKIFIDLEPLRNFNVRAKVVGPGGLFVKYIQGETGTRVQIKGQGSGFMDSETGRESDERMHIAVAGPDEAMVQAGKVMAEDLLDAVRTEYGKAHAVLVQQGVWVPPFNGAGNAQPQQQQWQAPGAGANGLPAQPQGQAPPPPEEAAPPPPPEDAAPPPPSEPAPPPPAEPSLVVKKKTPEEEALDKYWNDYKKWEDSFKAYHGRLPSKEDGGQDLPAQYR